MATRINPDRMRLFKEFTTLFLGELLRYPVVRDLDVVGIAFVGKDGVTLRVDRNLPHGGYAYSEEFLSFEEHPAWTDPDAREGFADYVARELLESLLMGTD